MEKYRERHPVLKPDILLVGGGPLFPVPLREQRVACAAHLEMKITGHACGAQARIRRDKPRWGGK